MLGGAGAGKAKAAPPATVARKPRTLTGAKLQAKIMADLPEEIFDKILQACNSTQFNDVPLLRIKKEEKAVTGLCYFSMWHVDS